MSQQFTRLKFHQQPPQQNTSLHGLITCKKYKTCVHVKILPAIRITSLWKAVLWDSKFWAQAIPLRFSNRRNNRNRRMTKPKKFSAIFWQRVTDSNQFLVCLYVLLYNKTFRILSSIYLNLKYKKNVKWTLVLVSWQTIKVQTQLLLFLQRMSDFILISFILIFKNSNNLVDQYANKAYSKLFYFYMIFNNIYPVVRFITLSQSTLELSHITTIGNAMSA